MEYSKIFESKYFSTAIDYRLNAKLNEFLLRADMQEELIFALWTPSNGDLRYTALINEIIFPETGDRNIHGNASYEYKYLLKVCRLALKSGKGIAMLHSHLGPGWQGLSSVDIDTEEKTFVNSYTTTNYPFVGMTIATDGYWSSRIWYYNEKNRITRKWANTVRVVGPEFKAYFNNNIVPQIDVNEQLVRTISVWGEDVHLDIMRLKIGIVGLGSVGSVVAEILARIGATNLLLIDFDTVEEHNLDRLCGIYKESIGMKKVKAIRRSLKKSSTANILTVDICEKNIREKKAYLKALDCDVIFCCVDRPLGRYILNHIAYAHLIPIIDGGILIEFDEKRNLNFADWTVHTATPGRPCFNCLNAYVSSDIELERQGMLDDPSYMNGLPENHQLKSRENIAPFGFNLASMEVLHFISLVTRLTDSEYYGEQKYRFKHGYLSRNYDIHCTPGCQFQRDIGLGDSLIKVYNE